MGGEFFPGANVTSDKDRAEGGKIDHVAGTCAMTREDVTYSVMDLKPRVFDVERLMIVDAIDFPLLPPEHPLGTVCKSDDCDW